LDKGGYLSGLLKHVKSPEPLHDANGDSLVNENGVMLCGCIRCIKEKAVPRSAEKKRIDNCRRAKKRAIKIITANFPLFKYGVMAPALLTVTYAGKFTRYAQADNYRATLRDLNRFLKVLRHIQPGIAYIWAPELQEKNGRNAVHFHILCFNLKYLTMAELQYLNSAWDKGFDEKCKQGGLNIKRFKPNHTDERRAMFYVAKYITKSGEWVPPECKLYGLSKGLILPVQIWEPSLVKRILSEALKQPGMVVMKSSRQRFDKWRNVEITDAKLEPFVPSTAKPSQGRLTETFTS
jgi:hypothetical protein